MSNTDIQTTMNIFVPVIKEEKIITNRQLYEN